MPDVEADEHLGLDPAVDRLQVFPAVVRDGRSGNAVSPAGLRGGLCHIIAPTRFDVSTFRLPLC